MKVVKSRKIARSLQNVNSCKRVYGKEIAMSIFELIHQLEMIFDYRQLWQLPGNFHRLSHLPFSNLFSITLKHPFRCIMRLDVAASTITLEKVCDYHGHYEKLFRK